jgi:hypothetical protein
MFCVFTFIFMCVFFRVSQNNFDLSDSEMKSIGVLAQNGDKVAMTKLINYYYVTNRGTNQTMTFVEEYRDVPEFRRALFRFLTTYNAPECEENMIYLATKLAENGDAYVLKELSFLYENGFMFEQNLTKANYWAKVAECNKQGEPTQECQEIKEE